MGNRDKNKNARSTLRHSMNPTKKSTLIVGLGNPGKRYAKTRHNIGFMIIDALVESEIWNLESKIKKFNAEIYTFKKNSNSTVILAKPHTYMNDTGIAILELARYYKIKPRDLWIVCDDIYLPLGKLRIRASGSSGGHKGLESVIEHLHTQKFPRLRIGIGTPPANRESATHVLAHFTHTETPSIRAAIKTAADALHFGLEHSLEKTMTEFNRQLF